MSQTKHQQTSLNMCSYFTLSSLHQQQHTIESGQQAFAARDHAHATEYCLLKLQVAQGLSQLSKTAAGTHPAYLRLDITGTTLSNPDAITHCSHLQNVSLGNNCLTTLQGLGALQQLTALDASRNQLTQVMCNEA
jgi:Leucine-rich repeat (LRR) protein